MSDAVIAVLISGGVALLVAAGGGLWKIITLILQTYKDQASATVDAKDADLTTKDAEIARLHGTVISELSYIRSELRAIREEQAEVRQDLWSFRRGETR